MNEIDCGERRALTEVPGVTPRIQTENHPLVKGLPLQFPGRWGVGRPCGHTGSRTTPPWLRTGVRRSTSIRAPESGLAYQIPSSKTDATSIPLFPSLCLLSPYYNEHVKHTLH